MRNSPHRLGGAFFLSWWLIACTTAAAQTTYRVDANATTPPHDGSTWCRAFLNLQDALVGVALPGDTILVADGTYRPDEGAGQFNDDRTSTFALVSGIMRR